MNPLKDLVISPDLLRAIAAVDEFKGAWRALGQIAPDRLLALRHVATIESVASSTRIEGSRLSDDEVEALLGGLQTHSFRDRDVAEVTGYHDVMELVFESWQEITLTENHVKQLHGLLLQHSNKDQRHRGTYKTLANHVEAFDPTGASIGIVFETATPFDTPRRMTELVSWTSDAIAADMHHPLLIVAVFVVRFLAIHPFQDGNGRLSRVLTTLLLLRAGYAYVPYASLERVIEDNKEAYYLKLRRAQGTLDGDESKLNEWVEFFVSCLQAQKNSLDHKVSLLRILRSVPPLSRELLTIARELGRITVAEATAATGAKRSTVKDHLTRLVNDGALVRRGRGRGTWYEIGRGRG